MEEIRQWGKFFQFTASYEADPFCVQSPAHTDIFQFTASYEADQLSAVLESVPGVFQFTASYEADHSASARMVSRIDLSIHSLIRG